jgi:16S rRNA (guanine966-N2)-methyltransferase
MSLRIIGGDFRRRKLRSNPGKVTRPITDRMKESLFERLGSVEGARVADVFSGTGTLGIECLSRGASTVVFFEKDRSAFDILQENISVLPVDDRAFCWRVDVRRTSFRPKGLESHLPYSLIFFDPPYPIADELAARRPLGNALTRLAKDSLTDPEAIMVLRTPNERPLILPPAWVETERTVSASSRISLCRKTQSDDGASKKAEVD